MAVAIFQIALFMSRWIMWIELALAAMASCDFVCNSRSWAIWSRAFCRGCPQARC